MARRSRTAVERIILQARIWGWDMSWSFSMATRSDTRTIGHHYSEHTVIKLYGSVRYPETFKYPTLECYLYVDPLLLSDKSVPLCIGSMQATGSRLIVYVAVHNERFNSLVTAASRLVALEINAEPLKYRKAKVMGIHLSTELESDW
ncbi:hypothetical protein CYL20_18705 [Pseudomonas palleroniana]|uniref:Uncharacterized protein n=1 Tax=Pseudomonas palleroniana TaxID=191390 RepID=A0A2L1JJ46_9PSED|nr:hypothetical protein CYL20_18705 [Pseudomonas palleroniana]